MARKILTIVLIATLVISSLQIGIKYFSEQHNSDNRNNALVETNSNGVNTAFAIEPVKLQSDGKGEIWQLPNGQFVFKAGSEAPPKILDQSSGTWKIV